MRRKHESVFRSILKRLFCLLMLPLWLVYATPSASASFSQPNEGWFLDGSPQVLPIEYFETIGSLDADGKGFQEATASIGSGTGHYRDYEIIGTVDGYEDYIISDARFSFSSLPTQLIPGEKITISVSGTYTGDSYDSAYYGVASGEAWLGFDAALTMKDGSQGYLSLFEEYRGLNLFVPGSKTQNIILTVPALDPEADTLQISCAVGGQAARQAIVYTYRNKGGTSTPVALSCGVLDFRGEPMPYLQATISGELDDGITTTTLGPDTVQTNVAGMFEWNTNLPVEATGTLTLRVELALQCWVKDAFSARADKTAFFLSNYNGGSANSATTVATILKADLEQERTSTQNGVISLWRDIRFATLILDTPALSFEDPTTPDELDLMQNSARMLMNASHLYNQTFNGLYTGVKVFGEKQALLEAVRPLPVYYNYTDGTSLFDGGGHAIYLDSTDTRLTDTARFIALHEYGHYFDWITGGGAFHCVPTDATLHDANHGGYMNDTTADSVREGFATWFACVAQQQGLMPVARPDVMGPFGSIASSSLPWVENGIREEFSIARAFWQLSASLGAKSVWDNALSKKHSSLAGYYNELMVCPVPGGLSGSVEDTVRQAFFVNGLYRLPAGSGIFEEGEPFRDTVQNGQAGVYDAGDLFADIPATLPTAPAEAFSLGSPSDHARARSSLLYANSWIALSGSVPESVLVTMEPEGVDAYRWLAPVVDGRVYVGLPQGGGSGRVSISVPGGKTVYTGDIAALYPVLLKTFHTNSSLDSVTLSASDLPAETVYPGPTGGSVQTEGLLNPSFQRTAPIEAQGIDARPFWEWSDEEIGMLVQSNAERKGEVQAGASSSGGSGDGGLFAGGGTGGNGGNGGDGGSGGMDGNGNGNGDDSSGTFDWGAGDDGMAFPILPVALGGAVIVGILLIIGLGRKRRVPQYPQPFPQQFPQQGVPQYPQPFPQQNAPQFPQPFPQQGVPQYPQQNAPASPVVRYCPTCGHPVGPNGLCGHCTTERCDRCGMENVAGAVFCSRCGARRVTSLT
jgi:hypothetical protein